jgi:hypothetical protein
MADSPNLLDLIFDKFREVVRDEIEAALAKRRPSKLLHTTKETAEILNVPESWLAAKARAGEVPCRMLGHYRYFSMADITAIMDQAGVDNGGVPVVHIENDGQSGSADSKTSRVESSKARGDDGDNGDDGGALGAK